MAINKKAFAFTGTAGANVVFRTLLPGMDPDNGTYARIVLLKAFLSGFGQFVGAFGSIPTAKVVMQQRKNASGGPLAPTDKDYLCEIELAPQTLVTNGGGYDGVIEAVASQAFILSRAPIASENCWMWLGLDTAWAQGPVYVEVWYELFKASELERANFAWGGS